MTDRADERRTLPIEQAVLLWCMRAWVQELKRPAGIGARIGDLLDRFGVPDAAPHLRGLMAALGHGASRMIDVQCVCCTRIAADERALLEVLGLAQAGRSREALRVLGGLVTANGARAALRSAEEVGRAMAAAGRVLPAPGHDGWGYAAGMSRPAGVTVH